MELSIVIISWNSAAHLERCLYSLFEFLDARTKIFEIFLVDNGSVDNTKDIANKFQIDHPDCLHLYFLEKNTGTTYARNFALKRVQGSLIAVIDSDVILTGDVFSCLENELLKDSTLGLVAPRLVYGDGRCQKSTDDFPTIWSKVKRYFFLKQIEGKEYEKKEKEIRYVDYAISAFWLFKKEMLSEVGFLDEQFFYAPEDVDYCLRIWKRGYRIGYVSICEAVHNAQEISRGSKMNKAFIEHLKGLVYYFMKHKYICRKPFF